MKPSLPVCWEGEVSFSGMKGNCISYFLGRRSFLLGYERKLSFPVFWEGEVSFSVMKGNCLFLDSGKEKFPFRGWLSLSLSLEISRFLTFHFILFKSTYLKLRIGPTFRLRRLRPHCVRTVKSFLLHGFSRAFWYRLVHTSSRKVSSVKMSGNGLARQSERLCFK